MTDRELQTAVDGFVRAWFPYTLADLMDHTSCIEAHTLCDILDAAGHGDLVPDVITMHAQGDDDCEDEHHAEYLRLTGKSCPCQEECKHRPDDDPLPGNRCKDCGEDLVWIGPGQNDWGVAGE